MPQLCSKRNQKNFISISTPKNRDLNCGTECMVPQFLQVPEFRMLHTHDAIFIGVQELRLLVVSLHF